MCFLNIALNCELCINSDLGWHHAANILHYNFKNLNNKKNISAFVKITAKILAHYHNQHGPCKVALVV